jgi:hypothetical protein
MFFALGKFPIGSASYMAWPGTSTFEILMTLHHVCMQSETAWFSEINCSI